jgi:hypothetical protein
VKAYYDARAPEYDDWRTLDDGTQRRVYKRWLTPESLLGELGGGRTPRDGRFFVAVAS